MRIKYLTTDLSRSAWPILSFLNVYSALNIIYFIAFVLLKHNTQIRQTNLKSRNLLLSNTLNLLTFESRGYLYYFSRHWMKCPLCKKRVNLYNRGVDAVDDNIYLPEHNRSPIIDDHFCGMCTEQDTCCRCSDCQTYLCTDCVGKHLRNLPETEHSIKNFTVTTSIKSGVDSEAVCSADKIIIVEVVR